MFKFILFSSLFALFGCTESGGHVELPFKNASKTIIVSEDTVLNRDYKGVSFKVINGAKLYAGNFTLDGRNNDNLSSFAIVALYDGSHLQGGNLQYGRTGTVISRTLPRDWKIILKTLPRKSRIPYVERIRGSLNGCSTISGTKYLHNRNSIYVQSLSPCAKISNVAIKYGRLGIYHDAYSVNTSVTESKFDSIGKKYYSRKNTGGYITYPSPRESVAIDGSSFNTYENNVFINGRKNAINLYVNCGEKEPNGSEGMPREEPSLDNRITGNTFENYQLAIHNSSRKVNRKTYPCRSDDQGDRVIGTVIESNTFINTKITVKQGNNYD